MTMTRQVLTKWVDFDTSLHEWWQSTALTKREFVSQYREELAAHIRWRILTDQYTRRGEGDKR